MSITLDPLTLSYPTDYQEPLFRTLAKFPEFADGPVAPGLEVNIKHFAMEQLGLLLSRQLPSKAAATA